MREQNFRSTGVADALDHGRVVHHVAEDDAAGELGAQSRERGVVGDEAGREDQSGLFAMERGELVFEVEVEGTVSCYVASAPCTGTVLV